MAERTVNLTELADVLRVSTNTLREVVRKAADFPVVARGSNGVAYEFDLDDVVAWWRANDERVESEKADRRGQLDLWRSEIFGDRADDDRAAPGLTATERRAEFEAQLMADKLRRQRGETIERATLERIVAAAVAEVRNGMLQVPAEFAKRRSLDREARIELESMIERRLDNLADRLGDVGFYDRVLVAA